MHDSSTTPHIAPPSNSPRLNYFISRSNGNIVPLIPADELPYKMRLVGIPRVMRMEQTCGMSHVGTHPITGQYFKLESDVLHTATDPTIIERRTIDAPKQLFVTPDTSRYERSKPDNPSTPTKGQTSSRQPRVPSTVATWRRAEGTASPRSFVTVDNTTVSNSQSSIQPSQTTLKLARTPTSPPSSGSSDVGDKVYCTHWIRHGECDYMQQGCRFKHEMPDKATLAGIGFRTVPRWWQERTAIRLGQSALPTVGPPMKPSEWMKMRKSSVSSQSDDESESDYGSKCGSEGGAGEAAGSEEKNIKSRTAGSLDKASQGSEHMAVLQPAKLPRLPNHINTQVTTVSKTETAEDSAQPSSPVSDLIDLDPPSPTNTCASHNIIDVKPILKPQFAESGVPTLPEPSQKQVSKPPRRIFVPAGESTDFHIADARKHAQAQEPKQHQSQRRKSKDQQKVNKNKSAEKQPPVATPTLAHSKGAGVKTGLQASKHALPTLALSKHTEVKTRLQASKHAPQPGVTPDAKTGLPASKHTPLVNTKHSDVKPGLSASKHAPQPGDATEATSSRAAGTPSTIKTKPGSQASSSQPKAKAKKQKWSDASRNGHNKQASASACRPRRPAPPRRSSSSMFPDSDAEVELD